MSKWMSWYYSGNKGRGHYRMGRNHEPNDSNIKRLNHCDIGEKVRVQSLEMKGQKSRRLMDMGLLPGTIIEITRIAPFGDPVAIKLRGFQMSFRRKEAEEIIVEPL